MMQAIQNKVIIRQHFPKEKKIGGKFILPESATKVKRPGKGTVITIGNDVSVVKIGDKVLHSRWEGAEIKDPENPDGEPLLVLKDTDLLAKLGSFEQ